LSAAYGWEYFYRYRNRYRDRNRIRKLRGLLHRTAAFSQSAQHCRLEISSPIGLSGLSVSLGDIERNRLTRPEPLIPGMPLDSIQFWGIHEYPDDIADLPGGGRRAFRVLRTYFFDFDSDPDFDPD